MSKKSLPYLFVFGSVKGAEYRSDRPGRLKRFFRKVKRIFTCWL